VSEKKLPQPEGTLRADPWGWTRLILPLITVGALWLESRYAFWSLLSRRDPVEEPGPEICLFLALLALLSMLSRGWAALMAFLLSAGTSLLWWIDAHYYRFFRELPSWHLLPTWRQAGKASESLGSLLRGDDAVLLLGPLLVGGVGLTLYLRGRHLPVAGRRIPLMLCALAALAAIFTAKTLPKVRWEQLQRRFFNLAIMEIFGPLYYHAYDSYEYGRVMVGLGEGKRRLEPAKVQEALSKRRQSALQETPFRGIYEGRDLILVQLESLEYFALEAEVDGRPVMPFLQHLASVGYGFRLFDQTHLGRSADGQFIYLNSLHPPADRPLVFVYPNNSFASALPKLFAEKGYDTLYLHPSDPTFWNSKLMATAYGFQTVLFRQELPARDEKKEIRGWGLTDQALFQRLLERTAQAGKPYFAYVVTMMCHHPYPEIRDEDTDFPPPDPESMVRRYLRCCNLRDRSLRQLVVELARTERGRQTVLCLVGDHDSNVTTSEKILRKLPSFPESEAVPMVLCTVEQAMSAQSVPGGPRPPVSFGAQMDLAPSLGHVFSLAMEQSVFLGWNLFSKQNSGSRISRLGTWMDRRGMIKPPEDTSEALDTTEFEVSEMLLQGDLIPEYRVSF
jgi:lipoteichoic acid synthase